MMENLDYGEAFLLFTELRMTPLVGGDDLYITERVIGGPGCEVATVVVNLPRYGRLIIACSR